MLVIEVGNDAGVRAYEGEVLGHGLALNRSAVVVENPITWTSGCLDGLLFLRNRLRLRLGQIQVRSEQTWTHATREGIRKYFVEGGVTGGQIETEYSMLGLWREGARKRFEGLVGDH
nr:hypothetical protein CYJ24_11645 [Actinomyces naeslundii]